MCIRHLLYNLDKCPYGLQFPCRIVCELYDIVMPAFMIGSFNPFVATYASYMDHVVAFNPVSGLTDLSALLAWIYIQPLRNDNTSKAVAVFTPSRPPPRT